MKIISREEFIKMPRGTVFSQLTSGGNLGSFDIKTCNGEMEIDFCYQPLSGEMVFPGKNWEEQQEFLDRCMEGELIPIDLDSSGRDGCFNDEPFLVLEKDDLQALVDLLSTGLK